MPDADRQAIEDAAVPVQDMPDAPASDPAEAPNVGREPTQGRLSEILPSGTRDEAGSRRPVSIAQILIVTVVAALVGAGSALGLARATGWGSTTIVYRDRGAGVISSQQASIRAILAKVLPSVVSVTATSTRSSPYFPGYGSTTVVASGTGIVVSRDGEVVTNDHVVSGATSVTVTVNGSSTPLPARVLGESEQNDLALLKITSNVDLTPARFGDSNAARVGDEVLAVGYALGLSGGPTVTNGIISAIGREVTTETSSGTSVTLSGMLQTDAAISSGNSGGPLVDGAAEVIGINTAVATSSASATAQNIGFAIPSSTVEGLVPKLRGG